MKITVKWHYLFLSMILMGPAACTGDDDEFRVPVASDGIGPGPVTEVAVTNLPGGARISYKLPDDDDALYVEALYTLDNGTQASSRSSIFENSVLIEGLRSTEVQQVTLNVVDNGENRSESLVVDVQPTTAPIDLLFESLVLAEDFGGVRIEFINQYQIIGEVQLLTRDETGVDVLNQSLFLTDESPQSQSETDRIGHTFRGLKSSEKTYSVQVIDRFDNQTEMISGTLTPLEEILIPKSTFASFDLDTDVPTFPQTPTRLLWDDNLLGGWPQLYHSIDVHSVPVIPPYTEPDIFMFTFDLGVNAKISRFKVYQRFQEAYRRLNVHQFEIWGTPNEPDRAGTSLEGNGWVKLVENIPGGWVPKPAVIGAPNQTELDIAEAGHDVIALFPPQEVRYIRFVSLEAQDGTRAMQIGELEVFGQVIE